MSDNKDRVEIIVRGRHKDRDKQFFQDIVRLAKEGYLIADNNLRVDQSMRLFKGNAGRVVMYKEGTDPGTRDSAQVFSVDEDVAKNAVIVDGDPVIGESSEVDTSEVDTSEVDTSEDTSGDADKMDDMDADALKEYAESLGIKIPGTMKKEDSIRAKIRESL